MFLMINPIQPIFEGIKHSMVVLYSNCEAWGISLKYIYPFLLFVLVLMICAGAIINETRLLVFTQNNRI